MSPTMTLEDELTTAAAKGHTAEVEALLLQGAPVNGVNSFGRRAIQVSTSLKHLREKTKQQPKKTRSDGYFICIYCISYLLLVVSVWFLCTNSTSKSRRGNNWQTRQQQRYNLYSKVDGYSGGANKTIYIYIYNWV